MMKGIITEVQGPVVDVLFPEGQLPFIKDALTVQNGEQKCVMEVAQHMGGNIVRCIMLSPSEGLCREMEVTFCPHIHGNFHTLPQPMAHPAEIMINPRRLPSCSLFSIVVDFPLFFFPNTALPRRKTEPAEKSIAESIKKNKPSDLE